ncbi:MAG TPA: DUF1207 domain-containing protein, partial [Pirellulales bacterium]
MRLCAALVLYGGLLALGDSALAQNWPSDAPAHPQATFAGPIYGIGLAAMPRTTYDDSRQSVLILDGPGANPDMATGAPGLIGSGVYPASATMPLQGVPIQTMPVQPTPSNIYSPAQQFQSADSGWVAPGSSPSAISTNSPLGSPLAYNTICPPSLSCGPSMGECIDHSCEPWEWQMLPQGLIWHSYLAGPKEPRISGVVADDTGVDTKLDGTVGGRVGLFRYGDTANYRPQGWQVDAEGAAFIREDLTQNSDVDTYDFRIGFPVTYGYGDYQMKLAWYHTSAHIGDEYQLKHPDFVRINYSRNAIVWGNSYFLTDAIRIYGEVEFGYWCDGGSKPWAFQVGFEYSPVVRGWI